MGKGCKFHNKSIKPWLEESGIKIYLSNNEGKSVFAKKKLKQKSRNWYIDKLDDIINEDNNAYHRTIKTKPVDVKDNAFIDFGK